jgi:hypothetical protein
MHELLLALRLLGDLLLDLCSLSFLLPWSWAILPVLMLLRHVLP